MPSPSPDPTGGIPASTGDDRVVAYFARDLFFGVRLAEGLARLHMAGEQLTPANAADLLPRAALALVDLSAPTERWHPLIEAAHRLSIPVLAFGSHMDQDRWQLARQAGASRIVANSALLEHFGDLVGQTMGVAPTPPGAPQQAG
jgi:hypothetical protein